MCIFPSSQPAAPQLPPETAAMQYPDGGAVKSSMQRRFQDWAQALTKTILTGGQGVTTSAPTDKKTLLGQ